jgi:hypothetical protein
LTPTGNNLECREDRLVKLGIQGVKGSGVPVKGMPAGTSKEISGLENKHLNPGILESSNPFHQEYFVRVEGKYERGKEKMDPASTNCSGQGNAGGKCAGRMQG